MDSCRAQAIPLLRTYKYTGWLENQEDLLFNDNPSIIIQGRVCPEHIALHDRADMSWRHDNTGRSASGNAREGQDNKYLERNILQDETCPGMILQDKACPGTILQDEACPGTVLQDEACPGTVLQDEICPEVFYHITTTWAMVLRLQRAMNLRRTLSQSRISHYESYMSHDRTSLLHYWLKYWWQRQLDAPGYNENIIHTSMNGLPFKPCDTTL